MSRARRLDAVDAALEAARREAGDAKLPPELRARILAATRSSLSRQTAAPRARVLDCVLRAAAVAAVVAAGLLAAPVSLEAAEFDARPLVEWNARLADALSKSIPAIDVAAAPQVPDGAEWPAAAAALALVAAGVALARRSGRR